MGENNQLQAYQRDADSLQSDMETHGIIHDDMDDQESKNTEAII